MPTGAGPDADRRPLLAEGDDPHGPAQVAQRGVAVGIARERRTLSLTRSGRFSAAVAVAIATASCGALVARHAADPGELAPLSPADLPARQVALDLETPSPTSRPASRRPNTDRLRGPRLPSSAPVSLEIPALDTASPLVRLGLAEDGTLQPPEAARDVGWFTGSVTPGEVGPSVIAGHVTWNGVPAAFFELATLRRGDRVTIHRRDGRTAHFTVTHTRRFPKAHFPAGAVYGPTDHAALRLITCGGRLTADYRYEDNVVVFARLVSPA